MRKTTVLLFFVVFLFIGCGEQESMEKATGEAVSDTAVTRCADSDNGIDKEAIGSVEGTLEDGSDFGFDDKCVGNIVIEYYCEDNEHKSQNLRCDNRCRNGACS